MAIKLDHQQNLIVTQSNDLNLDITGSLNLPSGTTANRPGSPSAGDIRFNSTTSRFEGHNGSNWKTFTTLVQDIDLDTYIQVEDADGADNDQIDFYTANTQRMVIHSDGNVGIGLAVPTKLLDIGGTLKASGAVTLDSTVLVGGIADFDARVDINDSTASSSTSTGALVVSGGAGVGGALNVGGDMNVGGTVTMTGNFQVSGTQTQLVSTSINQALIKLGEGTTTQTVDQGFIVTRGDGTSTNTNNVGAIYDESEDEVAFISCPTEDGQTSGNVNIVDYIKVHLGELEAEDNLTVKGITSLTGNLTSQGRGTFTELEVGDLANNKIVYAGSSGRLTTNSSFGFDGTNMTIDTTGTLKLPGGSNAQRPGSPEVGMIRYNTNSNEFEGYIGSAWTNFTTTTFVELTDGPGDFDPLKYLRSNSAGNALEWSVVVAEVVNDSTPQLGGALDLNSNNITGSGNIQTTGDITLTSADAGSTAGPSIVLARDSASPAGLDYLGHITFRGKNDASANKNYGKIVGRIIDDSDSSEDGRVEIHLQKGGSETLSYVFDNHNFTLSADQVLRYDTWGGSHSLVVQPTTPTADRTISFPDATGTLVVSGQGGIDLGSSSDQLGTVFTNNIHMHNAYHSHASTATSSSTAEFNVDQWPIATYRSAKYFISCENTTATKFHITQILVLHNGTDVYQTTYGSLQSDEVQFTVSADINGGNVRLRLTPATSNNMNYRFIAEKHLI